MTNCQEKDVRIILGNFDEEWALRLFCEAFREKMTGRKYQWILTGLSEDKLWQFYKSKGSTCSEQELLVAMDGYIITDITPVTRSQRRTISGMIAHEYSNEYKRRAQEMSISIEENKFYGYVYDGIWAIALALHRVDYQLKYYNRLVESGQAKLKPEVEGLHSLLDFDYHRPIWVKLIRNALNRTRFSGVTGTVSFQKNERPGLISFSQFQAFRDMNEVIIGSYDALNDELDLKVGFPIFWRGSSPPIDYTIQRVTPFRINRILFVIISILALFGIVLAFVFLTINIKFRNQRYIKMSSPYLNNLIIIGCILTYTSVIILGLDSGLTSENNFPYICNARAWVLMAGFTLAFGSMFSKTFRVHSIFTNIKLHKKVIKDYKLFMVVFILLAFDVCILIVWQYYDPFYRETNNGTSIQDSDNEDVIIVPEMEHCQSKRMTIFLSVIYVYKGLLMAFGCFLAWETRHVSIPALNDSKYIGLSVYNVVIMCVIGASLSFILKDQQDASFVIISIFIIFCSTTTLCLVFVPKLIELKQNPKAGDQRVRATLKTFKKNYREEALGAAGGGCRDIHGNLIGRGYGANLNERIKTLLDENIKQRSALKEKTYELEALTYKYRKIQGMMQSGQYLQALSTTPVVPSSTSLAPPTNITTSSTNLPTTLLLTSRSPTQDRVSFSIVNNTSGDKSSAKTTKVSIATTSNHHNQSTGGALAATTTMNTGDDDNNKAGLRRSPLMSSVTQITANTTTTSSSTGVNTTNTATDLTTTDYSSSKALSNATTSTDGLTASCSATNGDKLIATKQTNLVMTTANINCPHRRPLANYSQNLINASANQNQKSSLNLLSGGSARLVAADNNKLGRPLAPNNTGISSQSIKCNTDSSYCSIGPDYELCDRSHKSHDGDDDEDDINNLFTVFSYINATAKKSEHGRRRTTKSELAENSFSRWSEGPFYTLMVRNTNQQIASNRPTRQMMMMSSSQQQPTTTPIPVSTGIRSKQSRLAANQGDNAEIRASCPDIALGSNNNKAFKAIPGQRKLRAKPMRKQMSQQNDSTARSRRDSTTLTETNLRNRLPRTMSMIEYLGLNEFDLIARRHDKLLRQRLKGKPKPISCCYDAASCSYCAMASPNAAASAARVSTRCPLQSEGDIAFSSGDLLNSNGELIQTSSRLSCSTCCSLASPSFASQTDFYDEPTSRTSRSGSSQTVTSSASEFSAQQQRYSSNSQSSTLSSSAVDQDQAPHPYCRHHHAHPQPHHHHHHHHHNIQQNPEQIEGEEEDLVVHQHRRHMSHSSENVSQHTSSSSSIYLQQQQQQQQTTQQPTTSANESSLCTSGQLYCAPGAKEGANNSAQLMQSSTVRSDDATTTTTTTTPTTTPSNLSTPAVETDSVGREGDDQSYLIKCDVLESL